jgi:hypothetical protein
MLSGTERWLMRCKLLHEGRAKTDEPGRYKGFAFGQPSVNGKVDHMRVEAKTMHLDVGKLADEMKGAVEAWIQNLEARPTSADALNVVRNLNSLVRVTESRIPPQGPTVGAITIQTTISKTY